MKALTILLFSLFSLPLMLNAQTVDEMLHKVSAAIEAGQHGQAVAYKKNRNYDKAFLFYKELSQKTPDNVDYLEAVAEMQVCRGQEKDALRLYENILRLDADNLAANIFLGNYYYLMAEREKKKLESDYRKISSPTKMQYARYRDGLSKLFATGYEKARSSLQKVVLRFPSTEAKKTLDKILLIEKEVNR